MDNINWYNLYIIGFPKEDSDSCLKKRLNNALK